jgi:hypothetical protein
MRLALALMLWPLAAMADDAYLGPLIDGLSDADRSIDQIVSTLQDSGFSVTFIEHYGPETLPESAADPYYFHFFADVGGPASDAAGSPPVIMVACSRIGQATLNGLQASIFPPTVQRWDTADVAPGAVAQLWCRADLLPVRDPILRPDDVADLPEVAEVDRVLRIRFATVLQQVGEAAGNVLTNPGWVLPAPSGPTTPSVQGLPDGETLFIGQNPDPLDPSKPSRIIYDHWQTTFMHSIDIVSHLPPLGS